MKFLYLLALAPSKRACANPQGDRGPDPLPEKLQKYRVSLTFLAILVPVPWKIKKKFNVGPSSTRQQNAIEMVFCWRAADCPAYNGIWILSPLKNTKQKKSSKLDPF